MSMMMSEGVKIHCKAVTTQVFEVILVELGTAIVKTKVYLKEYTSIM